MKTWLSYRNSSTRTSSVSVPWSLLRFVLLSLTLSGLLTACGEESSSASSGSESSSPFVAGACVDCRVPMVGQRVFQILDVADGRWHVRDVERQPPGRGIVGHVCGSSGPECWIAPPAQCSIVLPAQCGGGR